MTKPIRYRWRRAIRKIDRRYVRMSPGNKDNGNNSRQDATIEIMGGLVIMREKERGILRFAEPSSVNVDRSFQNRIKGESKGEARYCMYIAEKN